MKRVKEGSRVIRGQMPVNTANERIYLDDGSFETGYKITRFDVWPKLPLSNEEFAFILAVQPTSSNDNNFQDVTQIGWAVTDRNNSKLDAKTELDPEAIIIQDLYITNRGGTDDTFCNYIIEMDKYEFPAYDGAANMVRNQSQGGPE
jgi:hypothetical protein